MRRGWHDEWDATEKSVWTFVARVWGILIGFWLLGLLASYIPSVELGDIGVGVVLPIAILAHLLTYVLMWLRKMQKKETRDRDRDR